MPQNERGRASGMARTSEFAYSGELGSSEDNQIPVNWQRLGSIMPPILDGILARAISRQRHRASDPLLSAPERQAAATEADALIASGIRHGFIAEESAEC